MSLGKIQNVCKSLAGAEGLSLQLLKIKISKKTGISYTGREVIFSPDGALSNFVTEISEKYTSGLQDNYTGVQDYDGSVIGNVIYKISISNNLIKEDYNRLVNSLANPNTEIPPLEFGAQAYVIKGKIKLNDENKIVRLITMQKPVTVLQHKFLYRESFKTLNGGLINRKEFAKCKEFIENETSFVISGGAGYGKSGCTESILNYCEETNIPHLAIKLDRKEYMYVFQLYGQYYSMIDMGYAVDSLRIHSIDDNKNYNIDLPENDKDMKNRFEQLISDMRAFDMDKFVQENSQKCANCIYEDACDRSASRGD